MKFYDINSSVSRSTQIHFALTSRSLSFPATSIYMVNLVNQLIWLPWTINTSSWINFMHLGFLLISEHIDIIHYPQHKWYRILWTVFLLCSLYLALWNLSSDNGLCGDLCLSSFLLSPSNECTLNLEIKFSILSIRHSNTKVSRHMISSIQVSNSLFLFWHQT